MGICHVHHMGKNMQMGRVAWAKRRETELAHVALDDHGQACGLARATLKSDKFVMFCDVIRIWINSNSAAKIRTHDMTASANLPHSLENAIEFAFFQSFC